MAYLELKLAGGQYHKMFLKEGDNLIGSSSEAAICITDPLIAPNQAVITFKDNHFFVKNLSEEHAVYMNTSILEGEKELQEGDELIMGSTRCNFHLIDLDTTQEMLEISMSQETEAHSMTTISTSPLLSQPSAAPPQATLIKPTPMDEFTKKDMHHFPYLEISEPGSGNRFFPLKTREIIVGGEADSPLHLNDPAVESRHAKFIKRAAGVYLTDMESRAGVFLNKKRVFREFLEEGDSVRIGNSILIFHDPMPAEEKSSVASAVTGMEPMAAAVPASIPFYRQPLIMFPLIMVILIGLAIGAYFLVSTLYKYQPEMSAEEARNKINKLIRQRDWEKARAFFEQGSAVSFSTDEQGKLLAKIAMEERGARYADEVNASIQNGELNSALDLFFKIPNNSVYRDETARNLINLLETSVDRILRATNVSGADYSTIISFSEKMLQIRPGYIPAQAYVCLSHLGQNRLEDAKKSADQMVSQNPQIAEGHYYKSLIFYRLREINESLNPINEALRLDPGNADFLMLRSKIEILLGRLNDARLDLDQVMKKRPDWAEAQLLYSRLTGKKPARPEAAPQQPTSVTAQNQRILQQRRKTAAWDSGEQAAKQTFVRGDSAAAVRRLDAMVKKYPDSPRVSQWKNLEEKIRQIQQLYQEGVGLTETDFPAAMTKWEHMRSLEKTIGAGVPSHYSSDVSGKAADYLAQRAMRDIQRGEMARAYSLARKALEWQPSHSEAGSVLRRVEDTAGKYYREGFRLYQHGNIDDAKKNWETVCLTVGPSSRWHQKAREKLAELEEMR